MKQRVLAIPGVYDGIHLGMDALEAGKKIGTLCAEHNIAIMVNYAGGFPGWVAMGALEAGGTVVQISPAATAGEHQDVYRYELIPEALHVFTGLGDTGAAVTMMRSSQAILCGPGRIMYGSFVDQLGLIPIPVHICVAGGSVDSQITDALADAGQTVTPLSSPDDVITALTQ